MSGILDGLPASRVFIIERALLRTGFAYDGPRRPGMMEEDENQTCGMSTVHDGERDGVASADYTTSEVGAPVIRWANSRGELLRIWQQEMRRLGGRVGRINLPILMGDMQ